MPSCFSPLKRFAFAALISCSVMTGAVSCTTANKPVQAKAEELADGKEASSEQTEVKENAPPSVLTMDSAAPGILADLVLDPRDDQEIDGSKLHLNSALGKVSATCSTKPGKGKRYIVLLKQWHPAPDVNTVAAKPGGERILNRKIPQAENQVAIYRMLDGWIGSGETRTLFAEGCEGKVSRGFEKRFNGWNLKALERRAQEADYTSVITHIGLKVEAKLGAAVDVECADNDQLLRMHDLAFSDARGVAGFLARLQGASPDDPKAKSYLAGVIELYKLPPTTTIDEAVAKLQTELKDIIKRIQAGFNDRNTVMMRKLQSGAPRPAVLVVGGAHTTDLMKRLEKAGIPCAVVEPVGYQNDADALMESLEKL